MVCRSHRQPLKPISVAPESPQDCYITEAEMAILWPQIIFGLGNFRSYVLFSNILNFLSNALELLQV